MSSKPPNLKEAHECGDCKAYRGPQEGKGRCTMYDYPVDEDDVCDSWIPADAKDATRRLWAKHRRRLNG